VEAEAELAVELLLEVRTDPPADPLHIDSADLRALDEDVVGVVDDHAAWLFPPYVADEQRPVSS